MYLQACRPPTGIAVPSELQEVDSPLRHCLQAWRAMLHNHPDELFRDWVVAGITDGFRIGFNWSSPLTSATRNIPSAYEQSQAVDKYVADEVAAGNLIEMGPRTAAGAHSIQINRIGVIPKGHTPGRWRIITDLSFPPGQSVNDGIAAEKCSLEYTTVDRVAGAALALGRGALLAKIDIKSAYRLLPVHPADRVLLGCKWQGKIYVDGKLPFGLRSAPKIFNAVADALEFCFRQAGVENIDHYLDDFITFGPPSWSGLQQQSQVNKGSSRQVGSTVGCGEGGRAYLEAHLLGNTD